MDLDRRVNGQAPIPDWEVRRLGDVGRWLSGGTPSLTNEGYWNGDIPWVSAKDMKVARLHDAQDHVSAIALGSGARLAPTGAVLMVVRGMILAHSFPVARAERPLAFNQDIKALVVRAGIDGEFILHWLDANKQKLLALATEATHGTKRIPSDDLFAIQIALPLEEEQRAIAAALRDVDSLLDAMGKVIAKKRDLKQAAMQQLLTGQQRLPGFRNDWEMKRLGDLFHFLNTANNPRADLSESGEVGYIHYGDIHTTSSPFLDCSRLRMPMIERSKLANVPTVEDGDLVMVDASEDNQGIGKAAEIRNVNRKRIVAGLHTFLLRGNRALVADGFKAFIQFVPSVRAALTRLATGISVYGISKSNVKSIEVLVPAVDEQVAIASVLSDMDAEIDALEARLAKTRAIKQGMMQELLTGRIRLV